MEMVILPVSILLKLNLTYARTFLGQCPPIILSVILAWLLIPNRGGVGFGDKLSNQLSRVDFLGGLLLRLTILSLLLPLELAGKILPWSHPIIYICLATSFVLFSFYCFVEQRWVKEPIMAPVLLMSKGFLIPNATQFCQTAAQLGVESFYY